MNDPSNKLWRVIISLNFVLLFFLLAFSISKIVDAWTNPTQAPPGGSGVGVIPAGTVSFYAGGTVPSGWLLCDGSSVSQATYPSLYSAIGTTYGGGGGNFNLPDLRGRVAVGKGAHGDIDVLGENEALTLGSRTPRHYHVYVAGGGSQNGAGVPGLNTGQSLGSYTTSPKQITNNPDGGPVQYASFTGPQDVPAYLTFNCIIKY